MSEISKLLTPAASWRCSKPPLLYKTNGFLKNPFYHFLCFYYATLKMLYLIVGESVSWRLKEAWSGDITDSGATIFKRSSAFV